MIYLFPALLDLVVAAAAFICGVRAVELGASAVQVAGLLTVNMGAYLAGCALVVRWVTPHNAIRMLMGACLGVSGLCVLFIFVPWLWGMYLFLGLIGVVSAFFFTPFQLFMKAVDHAQRRSVAYSSGMYTFSWSVGFALGPFITGVLWTSIGWQGGCLVCAAAALAAAGGIWGVRGVARGDGDSTEVPAAELPAYARQADFAWVGWVASGVGCMAFNAIRGLFPKSGGVWALTKAEQGIVLALLAGVQAVTALALTRSRWWMYRAVPLALVGVCGVGGLVLFARGQSAPAFMLGAAVFGIYSGAFFVYLVFHGLVHPARSARYVAISEGVVGGVGMVGPFVGGMLADRWSLSVAYLCMAGAVLGAVALQSWVHRRGPVPYPRTQHSSCAD
jgi:ACDE family multidrug resistance protein